jgi:hypothetical protein
LTLDRGRPEAGEAEYVTGGDVEREVGRKLVCESDSWGVLERLRSRLGVSPGGSRLVVAGGAEQVRALGEDNERMAGDCPSWGQTTRIWCRHWGRGGRSLLG